MNRCPQCATTYPDSARFCENDGTPLQAVPPGGASPKAAPLPAAETGEVFPTGEMPSGPVASGREPTRRLNTLPPRPAAAHAGQPDTGPLAPGAYGGPYAPSGPIAPLSQRSRMGPRVVVGVLVVLALVLTGIGGYLFLQTRQAELQESEIATRFETALREGQLVEPEGGSAYDWYNRLRTDFPRSARLASYQGQVLPEIQRRVDGFYDQWMQTSDADDSEWPTIRRLALWGYEMAPQSGRLHAQHLYADARFAFETGDKAEAERQYLAAIDAWPEWALPYNSLGFLKRTNRNYREAINWYQKAAQRKGDWAFPHQNMSVAYTRLNQLDDAERALDRASDLRPGLGGAWADLSTRYRDAERFMESRRAARRALSEGGRGVDQGQMNERIFYIDEYLGGYNYAYTYQEFVSAHKNGTLGYGGY
ncbi:MAG: hypothetical protein AAFQ53_03015 [Bacteroidota bacterium]